ncbi:kinesin-like protein costa [Cephus cinctus]|uniref:Kinesin-like protein costa n=1 Tax=Cephus cinctus TaxID=211228 RepID=A0AAJ7FV90_CEPCN|nr:kinesin-like protein costa [Cephus cinctus]XP_015609959.1 kinesin-like protein costa [Cephus cinctus]XP_015609960.1 kinesin-like protein costa [Cephus cinctus]XP_015609961.1 kinesin-like protein costa [Cephus cinctus]XP_015609963.1 kinesin-like protein costa [Cephus cinctus]XP_024935604.1 kinesin-like protein costa [Cephus cinctus]XP_024935605.1 kinesin-like protein costa [Cephus cinctus]
MQPAMMHYGLWIHPNGLDNRCYGNYIDETAFRHHAEPPEEESEQTGDETHDTTTSATSGEHSYSADLCFRYEFAAKQLFKLVSNAEGLFKKLVVSNKLPHSEQDLIEQWLCMEQEYVECIASDETASLHGIAENTRRSLERIEEVTETDEKTDESGHRTEFHNESECSVSDSEVSDEEEEEESDVGSENPDFLDKLDECMRKFKEETDKIVDSRKDEFRGTRVTIIPSQSEITTEDFVHIVRPVPTRNPNSRRNSMLPGSDMCNGVLAFNGLKPYQEQSLEKSPECESKIPESQENDLLRVTKECSAKKDNSPDLLIDALKTDEVPEPIKTLKTLALNNEAKQTQVKKIQSELEGAHKRIEELQTTIHIKERFIADMIKNSDARASAKQRFQRKRSKLEEEYYNTRTQLAQAENASLYKDSDEKSTHRKEIELYKNMAIHYEKRLMDIEMIKQIAGDSAKKVLELESSLNSSKKQMEKLKRQLKKEEERKKQLEEELAEDQRKIRDLEEKYNLTASKLKEMQSESEDERNNMKSRSDSCEKKKNLLEVSARISHLDHVLKEKSMDLERTADTDEKEALRHEIRNLRRTRDCLVDEKCDLDEKFQKERTLTTVEERKLLECGETIEAIDAMIEHKNEMICGRKGFDENQAKREKGERMLMERLAKLSDGEMRTLFYKYFLKVIDLKESSKNLEIQTTELEAHVETQEWHIQALSNALKQTKLEAERRIVLMQREHEEKLHLMFRHFAEETSSSGHERLDKDSDLAKYKRENRTLRRRLADVEALLKGPIAPRTTSPARIPQQGLKQITHNTRPTTKVTRQRNKLIIQKTTDCDRRKK